MNNDQTLLKSAVDIIVKQKNLNGRLIEIIGKMLKCFVSQTPPSPQSLAEWGKEIQSTSQEIRSLDQAISEMTAAIPIPKSSMDS